MNVGILLSEMGLDPISYTEVIGGADSRVWKVECEGENIYALRVLPRHRQEQFDGEKRMIDLAFASGVPVPKVLSVHSYGEWSTMLMQWAKGQTVLEELVDHPENAYLLGMEFGKVQAIIHSGRTSISAVTLKGWIEPATDEERELLKRLQQTTVQKDRLLHLDYHPLNVLTDGCTVTAVIDWANASIGDPRFDLARTMSILRLEKLNPVLVSIREAIAEFELGWKEGYEQAMGRSAFESMPLYYAWAGLRMIRDLAGRRMEEDYLRMRQWVDDWLQLSISPSESQ